MTDYERILRDFIKATKSAQSEYKYYYAKVNELDKATGDILHQFELGDSKERAKWATKLSSIRKERRYAKDMVAVTEPINKYVAENQAQIKGIERLLGEVRKQGEGLKGRKYSARVLKNLTISEERVK